MTQEIISDMRTVMERLHYIDIKQLPSYSSNIKVRNLLRDFPQGIKKRKGDKIAKVKDMNNQIKSEVYNKGFKSNAMTIYLFKSSRKNSKCSKAINVNHLISKGVRLKDERIISQFISTIESIIYNSKEFNNHLEISAYIDIFKNESFMDANNDLYCNTNNLRYNFQRIKFSSIEQCINFIFSLYCLIYPYNEISLNNEIYTNSSIKYFINKFYNHN